LQVQNTHVFISREMKTSGVKPQRLRRILVAFGQRGLSKPWMQLVPRSVCVREPLAHLLIGESIDLTTCVPLVKNVQRGRLSRRTRLVRILICRHPSVSEAEAGEQAQPDEEQWDHDPEKLAEEQHYE
jgi:hypothetical protein